MRDGSNFREWNFIISTGRWQQEITGKPVRREIRQRPREKRFVSQVIRVKSKKCSLAKDSVYREPQGASSLS